MRIALLLLTLAASAWGQAAWSPASISGCQVWLRADDLLGTYANGAAVSSWPSRCGSGVTATAVNTGTFATTGGPNGHAAVTFDGTNDSYTINWTGTARTVVAIYKYTGAFNANRSIVAGDVVSGTTVSAWDLQAASNVSMTGPAISASARMFYSMSGGDIYSQAPPQTAQWNILSGRLDNVTARLNFHRKARPASAAGSGTPRSSGATVLGGSYASHVIGRYFMGSLTDLILIDRALTDDELYALEAYQEDRYFGIWARNPYVFYGFCYGTCTGATAENGVAQVSNDGSTYTKADISPDYLQRDQSIAYYKGRYWMIGSGCASYTTNCVFDTADTTKFDLYYSYGGGVWIYQQAVTGCPGGGGTGDRTWSVDWFIDKDGSVHIMVPCITNGSEASGQIYEIHPTDTANLTTWSAPQLITVNGAALSGRGLIDPFVYLIGSTYYLFTKNGTGDQATAAIGYATASSLLGPYTHVANVWTSYHEGPSFLRWGQKWALYSDGLPAGTGFAVATTSDMVAWSAPVELTTARYGVGWLGQGEPRRANELLPRGAIGQ